MQPVLAIICVHLRSSAVKVYKKIAIALRARGKREKKRRAKGKRGRG
jgi:hypothetical protein